MLFLKSLLICLNSIFLILDKPMQKIFTLSIITTFIMLICSINLKSSWFFLIFFILMISGLMVLFIYMASLSNSYNYFNFPFSLINVFFLSYLMMKIDSNLKLFCNKFKNLNLNSHVNLFHNWNYNIWITILLLLLLFIMITYMELISNLNNSMRSKFNYVIKHYLKK